jgi:crotonobetainyl-CoA:carnitine CoA-transferase CaiB-like acyl-CoA transferase
MSTTHNAVDRPGALTGLKVLDLSRFIAGPHCATMLGDMGADVIKVERTRGGDDTRALLPMIEHESVYFMVFNRNKRSLTLDFRDPEGQELLRKLIAESDVLLENFRPGTMEQMGCDWDTLHRLNPRLIMARISGYGQSGPLASEPCFDAIAQASTGLMDMTGAPDGPPVVSGTFVVDYCTALYATIGILGALQRRHVTGEGQLVDVSLMGSAVSLLVTAIPEQMLLGKTMTRGGNRDRYSAPATTFKTRDGAWVYLIAGNDAHFPRLVRVMQRPHLLEDPRFATLKARMGNVEAIESIVASWVAEHDAEEIIAKLREVELPCAKVATIADVVGNRYMHDAGHIVTVDHPRAGPVPMQGPPVRLSESPTSVRKAAPLLGEDTAAVLHEWLALSTDEVAQLRSRGIV